MAVHHSGYDAQHRPDPVTPKTSLWAILLGVVGAVLAAAIDLGWHLPASNNLMDWVRSILILLFAAGGVYVGAQKAKREVTPLLDPRDEFLRKLVPVGTRPDTPDTPDAPDASGQPQTKTFNSADPGEVYDQNQDPGGEFFDTQGDRGPDGRPLGPGESPGLL